MSSRHQRRKRAMEKRLYLTEAANDARSYRERDKIIAGNRGYRPTDEERAWSRITSNVVKVAQGRQHGGQAQRATMYDPKDRTRIARTIHMG